MRMHQLKKLILFVIILSALLYLSHVFKLRSSQNQRIRDSKKHDTAVNARDKSENANPKLPIEPAQKSDSNEPHPTTRADYLTLENEMEIFKRDDMDSKDKMDKILALRQERLKEQCQQHDVTKTVNEYADLEGLDMKLRIVVSDEYKALFCSTGDVYSKAWENILGNGQMRSLYSYRQESISYRLKFYYKFLVVQQPLLRFLSAYKSNLLPHSNHGMTRFDYEKLQELSAKIRSEHDPESVYNKETNATKYARLVDFTAFVVEKVKSEEALHPPWERINLLCRPCAVQYDYISRAETAQDDAKYVFANLRQTEKDQLSMVQMEFSDESIEELRKELTRHLEEDIYNVYRSDHELFGYHKPWD